MAETRFPTDTSYRLIPFKDLTYGVEVTQRGKSSYTVDTFATEAEARSWVVQQKLWARET